MLTPQEAAQEVNNSAPFFGLAGALQVAISMAFWHAHTGFAGVAVKLAALDNRLSNAAALRLLCYSVRRPNV